MKNTTTKEQIEEAKKPKTRREERRILEGEPSVSDSWIRIYRDISRYRDPWVIRYFYQVLVDKSFTDAKDELFGLMSLVSQMQLFMQGIATYAERYPERIPELCAALAGRETLKVSWEMNAKEAVKHINNTPLKKLGGFVDKEIEDRKTVLEAWEKKQETEGGKS